MPRVEAMVNHELLSWARRSAGLSLEEAARKVQTKVDRLKSWETGEARPTIPQLRKLGNAYKRPIAVFYLSTPPEDFQAMHDYRRLGGEEAGNESPALRIEIRRARYRREVALQLMQAVGVEPRPWKFSVKPQETPEEIGSRLRDLLGISVLEQRAWKTAHEALNAWRSSIEKLDVLVFQATGISVGEMRGFSITHGVLPVIAVNIKDHPHGRIFTLAHELAHLAIGREGICDLHEHGTGGSAAWRTEALCNHIAAALLIPGEALLEDETVASHHGDSWSDPALEKLSKSYNVSREAVLRRLLTLEKTSQEFYRARRAQFLEEYRELGTVKTTGFAPPNRMAVSKTGPFFARLVLDAFYQEKITSSDVSDYLEVKLKWLPQIEEVVWGDRQRSRATA